MIVRHMQGLGFNLKGSVEGSAEEEMRGEKERTEETDRQTLRLTCFIA